MSKERYRSPSDIASDLDMSYMYDDIERIRQREEDEEKTQQNKLSLAGIMAVLAGVGMGIVAFGSSLMSIGMMESLAVLLSIVGFAALGYGLYKTVKLAFRRKELEFPTLNVYRKRKPKTAEELAQEAAMRQRNDERRRSRSGRTSRPEVRGTYTQVSGRKKLRRSLRSRVFTGLAGGIGEYLGINPWVIRFLWIMFAGSLAGLPLFLYLFLSIAIPPDYDREYFDNGGRNIHVQ
ncbi:MAG: PspC domain-containing protein [Bacteroidia bacterium]